MGRAKHPVQVYLDTNDYWAFATALNSGAPNEIRSLYEWLVEQRDLKKIEIRFSIVHVCELVNHAPENKKIAAQRCAVMREMCADLPMLSINRVLEGELLAAKSGEKFFVENAFAERGLWFPDFSLSFEDLRKKTLKEVQSVFRSMNLGRAQRKALQTKIFSRDGKLTDRGFALVQAGRDEQAGRALEIQNPLTERFYREGWIDKYFMGKISLQTITREMALGIFRPDNLINAYKDRCGSEFESVFDLVYMLGSNMLEIISSVQADMRKVEMPIGLKKDQVKAIISRAIPRGGVGKRLIDRFKENEKFSMIPESSTLLASCPTFNIFDVLTTEIVKYAVLDPRWNPLGSIGGDLAHAGYIPYVDVWRGDGPFCELIKKAGISGGAKIVRARNDLRNAIEEAIKKRGQ